MKKIIIAIDGHSSCGKSTMAKALAKRIGYTYVDTGAMYRAVTLFALRNGLIHEDGIDTCTLKRELCNIRITFRTNQDGSQTTMLNGENVEKEIRGMEVSAKVSPISALDFVRSALTAKQREMGAAKGVVMDGRDIGTAVYPNAELKVFVTASDKVRAQRRYDELKAKGTDITLSEVLKNIQERDYIDSHREVAPLRQAEDAIVLDNSNMTFTEQDDWLYSHYLEVAGKD